MEGATAWEYFWKITIPYISPMILASLVYTIVDSFVDPSNDVMTNSSSESKRLAARLQRRNGMGILLDCRYSTGNCRSID